MPRSTSSSPGTSPWKATSRPSPSTSADSSPASSPDAQGSRRLRQPGAHAPLPPARPGRQQQPPHPGVRLPAHPAPEGTGHGTVLAARPPLRRRDRTLPHPRTPGHAADPYHRIDIRKASRTLEVRLGDIVISRSEHPLVLFESGFAPRWYVPRTDIDETRLRPVKGQTFCP
ncbi:DUF427 domain-containing protein [Streptomyces sp. NBC_01794]|nr:DUF427 domain-containing protein [Streptomyces sp. NBC_01794]